MLLISFLASKVNTSTRPVVLGESSHAMRTAVHGYCEEAASLVSHDEYQSAGKFSVSQYCCSTATILNKVVSVALIDASNFYLLSEIFKFISNISESI